MIEVKFYGLNDDGVTAERGRLVWDGDSIRPDPPDSLLLQNVLASPAGMDDRGPVATINDPEAFLKALQGQYRSAYLRAGPPEETVEAAAKSARRVPPSPFRGRKSLAYFAKGEGQPCRQGETAARSRCIPASDEGGKQPTAKQGEQVQQPAKPQRHAKPKKTLKERARAARDRFNKIKEKVKEGGRKAADKAGYAVVRTKHFFQELAEKVLGKATAEEAAKVYEVVQDTFNEVMLGEDYDIPDDPSSLGLDIALNLIPDTVAWLWRWGRKKFTGVDPREVKYSKALKEGVDLKAVAKLITKYIDDLVEKGFDVEPLDEEGVLELLERNWAKYEEGSLRRGEKTLSYRVKMKEGKDTAGRRYCWDENTGNRIPCSPGPSDSGQQAAAPEAAQQQPQQPQQPRPKQSRKDARRASRIIAKKRVEQRKAQTKAVKEMLDKVSVGSIKKAIASAKQAVDAAMQKFRNTQAAAKAGALKMVDWAAKEFNLDPDDVNRIKKRLGDYNEKETEELGKKGEYGPRPGPSKIGSVLRVLKSVAPEMTAQIVRRLRVASGGGDPRERPASDKPTLARRVLGPKVHRAVMQALGQQHVDTPPTPEQTARLQQKLQEEWDRMQREGGQKALSWLVGDRGGALVPPPAQGKFATPFRNRKGIPRRNLEVEQFGKLLAGVKAIRRSAKNPNYCYDDELKKRVPCDKKPTGEGVNTGKPQKEEQPVKKPEYLEDEDVRQAQAGVDQALERVNRARQTEGIADNEYAEQAAEFAERQYAEAVEIARRKREAENFTGVDEEGRYWHNGVRQPEFVPSRSPDEIDSDIAQAERDLDLYRRLAEGAAQPARRAFQYNVERTERELEELRRERADAAESQDSREPTPEEVRAVHNPETGRQSAVDAIENNAEVAAMVRDGDRLGSLEIEQLSEAVHNAWMDREASLPGGGRSSRRHLMIPYDQLSEADKEKDRAFVREVVASMRPKDYWGSKQQPFWRPGPNPTVDTVVTRQGEDGPEVLLIRRKEGGAEGGKWVLPGGFINTDAKRGEPFKEGKETPQDAALRELAEESGLDLNTIKERLKTVGKFDSRGRDPRDNAEAWAVSDAFAVELPPEMADAYVEGRDDADRAEWVPVSKLGERDIAFDHRDIIARSESRRLLDDQDKKGDRWPSEVLRAFNSGLIHKGDALSLLTEVDSPQSQQAAQQILYGGTGPEKPAAKPKVRYGKPQNVTADKLTAGDRFQTEDGRRDVVESVERTPRGVLVTTKRGYRFDFPANRELTVESPGQSTAKPKVKPSPLKGRKKPAKKPTPKKKK